MTGRSRRELTAKAALEVSRTTLLRATTEADLMSAVIDEAIVHGWLVFHDTDSRKNTSGLPDLILVRPPRVVFVELKREDGTLRPDQKVWLDHLGRCETVETYLWRPSDRDAIDEALRR